MKWCFAWVFISHAFLRKQVPAAVTSPAGTCDFAAYCNLYPDLVNAFCDGGPCTAAHAAACENHWNVWGMGEGRECPAGAPLPPAPVAVASVPAAVTSPMPP